jgi:hypothetical protein
MNATDTFADGIRSIIAVLRPKGPGWTEVPGCGAINNRIYPFCERCSETEGALTAADLAYLEWKATRRDRVEPPP